MNVPNKLTVTRIVLAPVFLALMMASFPYHYLVSLLVFIIAALTDMFDGKIARKRGLITNLGKFLDPLADKMLTTAAFLGFMCQLGGAGLCWAVMLILTREFMVTSVRLLAAKDGVVIAASMAGKTKTVMQFISIIYMLLVLELRSHVYQSLFGFAVTQDLCNVLIIIGMVLIWVAVALTMISGFQYVWQCRKYFRA